MRFKKLIKKINKENAPPGGWSLRDKVTSSRRGGPAHKESGFKPSYFRMVLTNKRKYMRKLSSAQAFKLDRSGELG